MPPPSVPPLPASTLPPPFVPLLVSIPSSSPETVIVTLETSTQSFRTTLSTLTSRPSHLADYLLSLSLPAPTSTLHVFLDRPSSPYPHILSFLRQHPLSDSLPYALQLHNYTSSIIQASSPSILQSKLDALVEVRDEAAYLNLYSLHKLCVDEIKNRYTPKLTHGHVRGLSSSSIHSLQASIYNLHPLQEKAEPDVVPSPVSDIAFNSTSTTSSTGQLLSKPHPPKIPPLGGLAIATRRRSKQPLISPPSSAEILLRSRTPPSPQSLGSRQEQQQRLSQSQLNIKRSRSTSMSRPSPPAGWI